MNKIANIYGLCLDILRYKQAGDLIAEYRPVQG